jgi:tetratricopeptide (TPR) repeat protein
MCLARCLPLVLGPLLLVSTAAAGEPVLTEKDLDALARRLLSESPDERLQAARRIAAAPPDSLELLAARLRRPVPGETATFRALIHAIWGQYPNPEYPKGPGKDPPLWFVRPEPKWVPPPRVPIQQKVQPRPQRPPKHDPEAVDWLTALARLDLAADELTRDLPREEAHRARGEALLRVALLRAISAAGQTGRREALHPLFEFAFVRDGLFRDECGRMVRAMGSYAVPALIRIYHDKTRGNARMRRYASYQLDRMDRLRPSKAITTAPDDLTRAEIIHAYGEARALDAVDAILRQVDANSHRVRREARWAWMRYVDGPPPPPSPKRKRKLPGGVEEAEEKEDYLNYRELATLAVQKAVEEVTGHPPDPRLSARQLTDQLLAYYDQRREQQFAQLFDSAVAREQAGDLQGAVDEFGWILANQPDHPRRREMAAAFLRLGQQLAEEGHGRREQAKVSRALGLLRQALALDPGLPDARRVRAQIHFLDGRQAQLQGGDGVADFKLAVAADPAYPGAQQALLEARARRAKAGPRWPVLLGSSGLIAALCYLFWRRFIRPIPEPGPSHATLGR